MSPEPDDYEDEEELEEEAPRSIFAATWFRLLLGVILLGVVGVLALPYVLDWLGPSARPPVAVLKPPPTPPAKPPAPMAVAQPPQAAPQPAGPSTPPPPPAVAGKPAEPAPKPVVSERAAAPTRGDYWVQVGAFQEAANAARLAARLAAEKYSVQRAAVTRGESGGGGNEVFVAGASRKDLLDRVTARGYAVEAARGGSVVRPPLPLREAVALSRELADAGMEVKIRRVGGGKATFHLVRVGGFPGRSKAEAVRRELEGKGIPGFIAKGAPR